MNQSSSPVVAQSLADAFDALKRIAQEHSFEVHVSMPSQPLEETDSGELSSLDQQRADLVWLQTELEENKYLERSLQGNYVGVHKRKIIAKSPSYPIARLCVGKVIGDDQIDHAIIVPLQVRDQDAEHIWRNLQCKLGIAETT